MTVQELKPKKSNKQANRNEQLIMFRKPMSNVVLRRLATAITALTLSLSGLVFSPAQAAVPADGSYKCGTGKIDGGSGNGYYQINNGVVGGGGNFGAGYCTGAVVIPDGVTSIGLDAFLFAHDLTSINIPASVTSIGRSAFHANHKLTSITIPASVTSIGQSAFWNNQTLATVTFAPGSQLGSIGNEAFAASPLLKSITIPSSVTSIGNSAFSATGLTTLTFAPGSQLTSIGDSAFKSATLLKSITIPAGVTSIGVSAFQDATVLADVFFSGITAPTVGAYAFTRVASLAKAYIKSGATGYTPDGSGKWNELEVVVPTKFYEDVSFNSKGGSTVPTRTFAEEIAAPAAPTRTGHTFAGWSATDGGAVVAFPYSPPQTAAITLYAKWTKNPVKAVASTKPSVTGKAIATTKGTNKLTASKGTWTGFPTPVISYQWYSCTAEVKSAASAIPKTCKSISKATASTLAVTNTYKGKFLAVAVTGKGAGTTATIWLSKSTAKVK